jgi:hypothetical protein
MGKREIGAGLPADDCESVVTPRVIADRGAGTYLIDLGGDQGQICDTRRGMLFPPKHLDALLARGYWTPVADVDVADVLAMVTTTPSP